MTRDEIYIAIRNLPLEDVAQLRRDVADILLLKVGEAKAHREANCPHTRAKEGEYYAGLVTWHCPDCGASRQLSHYRERGTQ